MPGLESGVRPVGRRGRLEGREFRRSVWPEGLEFCLESGVPPGGPRVFFFSVRRAAFCLRVALARRAACWSDFDGREVRPRGRRGGPWGRSMAAASARGVPLGHSNGFGPRRGAVSLLSV